MGLRFGPCVGLAALLVLFLGLLTARAQVTVYTPPATPQSTGVRQGPPPKAANETAQPLPPLPQNLVGSITINVNQPNVSSSIPQKGNFLGVSLELSVADEILGEQADSLNTPFLNYMAAVAVRAGRGPVIRVGGNTQDTAIYNTSQAEVIKKTSPHGYNPTTGAPYTPSIEYSSELLEIMAAIATQLDADIIFGLNMVDNNADFTPPMTKDLQRQLGDHLYMLLVGNEPDRYAGTGARPPDYSIGTYLDEWGNLTDRVKTQLSQDKMFVAPSVCCQWTTHQITVDNGMQSRFQDELKAISAIKYPQSLCSTTPPYGHAGYLNNSAVIEFAQYDTDAIASAVAANVPYILAETNSASCIGVEGVSDAFTSAIWGVNAAMQMAYRNHSNMLLHTSGQSTIYNLFTSPAYNSTTTAWVTGPIFYSLLVVAEALGSSNASTVKDLQVNSNVISAYGVYENGVAQRVVLLNQVNDPSGNNVLRAQIPSNGTKSVQVKYLLAPSIEEKANITWANQTFGYYSDGTLQGTEQIMTVNCQDMCNINVPAPGVALVFLQDTSAQQASVATSTFAPAATANPSLILNSNGYRGKQGGATSKGSTNEASARASANLNVLTTALRAVWIAAAVSLALRTT